MNIEYPTGGGIAGLVYWMVKGIMSWGWVSYGLAIVFFTLFIKLMVAPLDFLNRYLTRRTQIKQQALAAEVADLNKIYGNDPLAFTRARQELYRKNGVGGLGSTLVSLISMIVTLVIFIQVFAALNNIAAVNIKNECDVLQRVYAEYYQPFVDADGNITDENLQTFKTQLNQEYQAQSFIWIKNIWQPDSPLASPIMSMQTFNSNLPENQQLTETAYNAIVNNLDNVGGCNGFFILALLAGATSFLSSKITSIMTKRNAPKKTPEKKAEPIITYSLRDAKQQGQETPAVDPAQVGKIMQFIMPAIFMFFALSQTSAFAIYMIASSIVGTGLTLLFSWLIDLIIKHQKPIVGADKDFDATIINPHAKYFKGGKK